MRVYKMTVMFVDEDGIGADAARALVEGAGNYPDAASVAALEECDVDAWRRAHPERGKGWVAFDELFAANGPAWDPAVCEAQTGCGDCPVHGWDDAIGDIYCDAPPPLTASRRGTSVTDNGVGAPDDCPLLATDVVIRLSARARGTR